VRSDWLWVSQTVILVVLALIARGVSLRRKLRERRADTAFESYRSFS
jgi:hypothetical protein